MPEVFISGLGVTSAIGQGRGAFSAALLRGEQRFGRMQRHGRQWPIGAGADQQGTRFIGAELAALALPEELPASLLRTASLSSQVALATVGEAWNDASLDQLDPARVGLVVGGSNFQQRELVLTQAASAGRFQFLRPTYAQGHMDSDLAAICTERFGIRAFAHTVGGASASGQLAVIEAIEAVRSGRVDACVAVGALMDLSCFECQGFRAIGAMGSDRFADDPARACRPFDRARDGFIYGENCAAVVLESGASLGRRRARAHARASGWSVRMEGTRSPQPSLEAEAGVMRAALAQAGWSPADIDYVNPHGSGSPAGDEVELQALRAVGLQGALLNSTKSLTGHGLCAAGAVEVVATLLQMEAGQLHPSLNLDDPIDPAFEFVRGRALGHRIERALTLSYGFGGINTALCLERP